MRGAKCRATADGAAAWQPRSKGGWRGRAPARVAASRAARRCREAGVAPQRGNSSSGRAVPSGGIPQQARNRDPEAYQGCWLRGRAPPVAAWSAAPAAVLQLWDGAGGRQRLELQDGNVPGSAVWRQRQQPCQQGYQGVRPVVLPGWPADDVAHNRATSRLGQQTAWQEHWRPSNAGAAPGVQSRRGASPVGGRPAGQQHHASVPPPPAVAARSSASCARNSLAARFSSLRRPCSFWYLAATVTRGGGGVWACEACGWEAGPCACPTCATARTDSDRTPGSWSPASRATLKPIGTHPCSAPRPAGSHQASTGGAQCICPSL